MNLNSKLIIAFSALFFLTPSTNHADEKKGMIPVGVQLLFSALPKQIEGWELKHSKGWKGQNDWLESMVRRDFHKIDLSVDPPQTMEVRLTIKDTAKHKGGNIQQFAEFKPAKFEDIEYVYIEKSPAILVQSDGRSISQLLINERFILTISLKNIPFEDLDKWYKKINIEKLRSVKDGTVVKLPHKILVSAVDQLDPSKTLKYILNNGEAVEEGAEPEGNSESKVGQ